MKLQFDMKFTKGNTIVAFEKLWYLQRAHAERYVASIKEGNARKASLMTEPIMEELKRRNLIDGTGLLMTRHKADAYVINLLQANARVYTNALAFIDRNTYFFQTPDRSALLSSRPSLSLSEVPGGVTLPTAQDLREALSILELIQSQDWTAGTIRTCINSIINTCASDGLTDALNDQFDVDTLRNVLKKSWSKLVHAYIRWAITASMPGPDSAVSMEILGRKETLARFETLAGLLASEQVEELGGFDSEHTESPGAVMEKAV
jgi:glutamyl-tRNA synthetase